VEMPVPLKHVVYFIYCFNVTSICKYKNKVILFPPHVNLPHDCELYSQWPFNLYPRVPDTSSIFFISLPQYTNKNKFYTVTQLFFLFGPQSSTFLQNM